MLDAEMLTSLACVVRLVPYSSRVGSLLEPGPEPPPAAAPTASWLSPTMRMTWERTLSPCNEKHMVRTDWCHALVSSNRLLICSQQVSTTVFCRQQAEEQQQQQRRMTQRVLTCTPSASSTREAMPSPSRSTPSRMCSVPM